MNSGISVDMHCRLRRRTVTSALLGGGASLLLPATAPAAEPFPARMVRLVVGFPPGGGADLLARPISQALAAKWRQSVIVDNKPGASGMIGAAQVAAAAPDGSTILVSSSSEVALNTALFSKMTYNPLTAFTPISLVAQTPMLLVTNPSLKIRTVKDLVAHIGASPGKLNYASGGNGTPQQFAGELFSLRARLTMNHVPYKSGGLQVLALVGGEIDIGFTALAPAVPFVKSGKLEALAITSTNRSPLLPEVPTLIESGMPDFEIVQWYAAWLPAGAPAPLARRIAADLREVVRTPAFVERMAEQGLQTIGSAPEELARFQALEIQKYKDIATKAGIRPDQ